MWNRVKKERILDKQCLFKEFFCVPTLAWCDTSFHLSIHLSVHTSFNVYPSVHHTILVHHLQNVRDTVFIFEPPHDKTYKMGVCPAKTQISLDICPVWSESSLSTWGKLGSLATHCVLSEDWSDWVDAKAYLSLRWVHSYFVGFVVSQPIWCPHF